MKIVNDRQASPFESPWCFGERFALLIWEFTWCILCSWTPKPLNFWRLFVLRIFGAKLTGTPFVHQRARIQIPWNLHMEHRACLGDRTNAYSLGVIEVCEAATVAQEAYLCTGSHDFTKSSLPLIVGKITIGANSFVGARAMVLPGVNIGEGAIVGAMSVVCKDVDANSVVAGNPAKPIRSQKE